MEVDLHVTNNCTLRCQHCVYMSGELPMDDMTLDDVKNISRDFKKLGVEEVHLTGGEPLLNLAIFDIIRHLYESGYKVRIQTNGMLINEISAQKLKDLGVNSVLISVDGMENTHNIFRKNKESFALAISAARTCLSKKIFTRINTVVHKDNLNEIEELLKLTSQLGVDQHSFFYLTPIGRGKNLLDKILSLEEWKIVQKQISTHAQKLHCAHKVKTQDVFHETPIASEKYDMCRNDNCLILANGDVFSCVFFVHSEYKLGNIHDRELFEIWQDPAAWQKMTFVRKKSCPQSHCTGGCPGLAYLLTGKTSLCDPRCRPAKKLFSSCIRKYVDG